MNPIELPVILLNSYWITCNSIELLSIPIGIPVNCLIIEVKKRVQAGIYIKTLEKPWFSTGRVGRTEGTPSKRPKNDQISEKSLALANGPKTLKKYTVYGRKFIAFSCQKSSKSEYKKHEKSLALANAFFQK